MKIDKFRKAALEGLMGSDSPHAARAIDIVNKDGWGEPVAVHYGQDYIVLKVPGEIGDHFIADDVKRGIWSARIAGIMINVAKYEHEREEEKRIETSNWSLAGRVSNMMTHIKYPLVNVAPSKKREECVTLSSWGEFNEEGARAVFESLKSLNATIKEWSMK